MLLHTSTDRSLCSDCVPCLLMMATHNNQICVLDGPLTVQSLVYLVTEHAVPYVAAELKGTLECLLLECVCLQPPLWSQHKFSEEAFCPRSFPCSSPPIATTTLNLSKVGKHRYELGGKPQSGTLGRFIGTTTVLAGNKRKEGIGKLGRCCW